VQLCSIHAVYWRIRWPQIVPLACLVGQDLILRIEAVSRCRKLFCFTHGRIERGVLQLRDQLNARVESPPAAPGPKAPPHRHPLRKGALKQGWTPRSARPASLVDFRSLRSTSLPRPAQPRGLEGSRT